MLGFFTSLLKSSRPEPVAAMGVGSALVRIFLKGELKIHVTKVSDVAQGHGPYTWISYRDRLYRSTYMYEGNNDEFFKYYLSSIINQCS